MITIEQIWSLALPVGTTLVAGLSGLQKSVTWPIVLRARAPGFGVLRGGELAIMNVEMLRQLDERLTLTRTIERLAVAGVVGIAVLGEIEASAFAAADDTGTPLFQLPANTSRTELEATIRRLIADQHTSFAQHSENVMSQLHALALNGQGTIQIIGRAVELLGRPVALTDRSLTLREFVGMPGSSLRASDAAAMLSASSTVVLEWAQTTALSPASPPTGYFGLAPPDITHLVAPIVSQGAVEGWLSAIGHGLETRETDRQTIAHAAAACAIGFVRDRAIRLAESSATGLLVADLILAESDRPSASIVARAERTLGLDSAASYAVIAIDTINPDQRHLVEAEIGRLGGRGLWKDNGQFLGFFPTSDEARKASCQAFILAVVRANGVSVRAGVGPIARGLASIGWSRRDAERAITLGSRISMSDGFSSGEIWFHEDMLVPRFLSAMMEANAGLLAFRDELLSPLEEFDRSHGGDLMATLAAFVDENGSPTRTATRLGLHRGSLQRRLDRISTLSQRDLREARDLLELQVAIRSRTAGLAQAESSGNHSAPQSSVTGSTNAPLLTIQ